MQLGKSKKKATSMSENLPALLEQPFQKVDQGRAEVGYRVVTRKTKKLSGKARARNQAYDAGKSLNKSQRGRLLWREAALL